MKASAKVSVKFSVMLSALLITTAWSPRSFASGYLCSALFEPNYKTGRRSTSMAGPEIGGGSFVGSGGRLVLPSAGEARLNLTMASEMPLYDKASIQKEIDMTPNLPEALKAQYERMLAGDPTRYVISVSSTKALDPLYSIAPNFKEVLDALKGSLAISVAAGEPVRFAPIILLGEPGVGKTFFAEKLAEVLGTGYEFISMSTTTAGWIISGVAAGWKDARMGQVALALLEKKSANPVIVVDEIDKASGSGQYDPLGSLYQLWEPGTAAQFRDEFVRVPLDASSVNWIATANDISRVPEPIRKRALVFTVPKPTAQQLKAIVNSIFNNILHRHPRLEFSSELPESVVQSFESLAPRDVRLILEQALGKAVLDSRRQIQPQDIDLSQFKPTQPKKNPIGFIHPK